MVTVDNVLEENKSVSWQMFDGIAPRYDFVNRLLSLGQDLRWRKALCRYIRAGTGPVRILDLATGTADVLIGLRAHDPRVREGIGLDMSEKMLSAGRKKLAARGLAGSFPLMRADAHQLPFAGETFDVVTMAFGIRNMHNPVTVLMEINRVLKPGGRALILEFSRPGNPLVNAAHVFYLRTIVPAVGGVLSGRFRAYRYLNRTIEHFAHGQRFCRMMEQVGLDDAQAHPLFWGAASVYQADKP